jgi:virginiamycin B lyase
MGSFFTRATIHAVNDGLETSRIEPLSAKGSVTDPRQYEHSAKGGLMIPLQRVHVVVAVCGFSLAGSAFLALAISPAIGAPQTEASSTAFATETQVVPKVTRVRPRVEVAIPEVRGAITEFLVPTHHSGPAGITEGPDGKLWFVENNASKLAAFDVGTQTFLEYRIPTRNSFPVRIAADSFGNLWFTESGVDKIGEFTIATQTFHEFQITTSGASPFGIAVRGATIWFAEQGTGKIGSLSNGVIAEYEIPTRPSEPDVVIPDEKGTIWFNNSLGEKIGTFDPETQEFVEYPLPNRNRPFQMVRGPDDTFWFSIEGHYGIGRITSAGEVTRFSIPTRNSRPYGIVHGADGAFWFEEGLANKIGRITPEGEVTDEFPIPTPKSGAHAMIATRDHGIWFTEIFANKIATITAK